MTAAGAPQIDLGVFHYDPDAGPDGRPPELDPGPTDWLGLGRTLAAGLGLSWRPALLSVLLLGLLASAGVPAGEALSRQWTVPGGEAVQIVATGDALYTLDSSDAGLTLRGYHLADGRPRWEVPLAEPTEWASLVAAPGVLLVTQPHAGTLEVVTAHDPLTGAQLWQTRGWVHSLLAGDRTRVLVARPIPTSSPADDRTFPGDGAHPYEMAAVDLATGAEHWRRAFGAAEVVLSSGLTGEQLLPHLVTVGDGRMTRYDPATGVPAATVDLPEPGEDGAQPGYLQLVHIGTASLRLAQPMQMQGHLESGLVVLPAPGGLAGYDPVTLRRRWQLRLPQAEWAVPCQQLVCAFSPAEPAGLAGIDPATGRASWSLPCDRGDLPQRSACMLVPVTTVDGVLLVRRYSMASGELGISTWAVDAATGRLVGALPQWAPAGWGAQGGWLAGSGEQTGSAASGPQWLARWRSHPPGFDLRGPIDADWCDPVGAEFVVCRRAESPAGVGRAEVWRLG